MWLVNTKTIELEELFESDDFEYAILSHTWIKPAREEVSFQDMFSLDGSYRRKQGYAKIKSTCEEAARRGFDYVWIDTCCIDKKSSAELSEAINSMWKWYEKAGICLAYLADVPWMPSHPVCDSEDISTTAFGRSKWFTRGWTLQELIAPKRVVFFSRDWNVLGDKSSLRRQLHAITGVSLHVFQFPALFHSLSVAERMSWAATRETTREEDRAYSLLGLFGINMPLLYGEGEMAFRRLQEEIMKVNSDHSLFYHHAEQSQTRRSGNHKLLADSPSDFQRLDKHAQKGPSPYGWDLTAFYLTNAGLLIQLPLITPMGAHSHLLPSYTSIALLNVVGELLSPEGDWRLALFIARVADDYESSQVICEILGSPFWYPFTPDIPEIPSTPLLIIMDSWKYESAEAPPDPKIEVEAVLKHDRRMARSRRDGEGRRDTIMRTGWSDIGYE